MKKEWKENVIKKEKEAKELVDNIHETFRTNPEVYAEALAFSTKFYKYSQRNQMLLYAQNDSATYVQSFKAWKDLGCSVQKGEKGLMVLVPVNVTYLDLEDGTQVQLRNATKDQAAAYKKGEINSKSKLHFKIGTVFDISQTNFPEERYPELYNVGYSSEYHDALFDGLKKFSETELNCPVNTKKIASIALKGTYIPSLNEIEINDRLKGTEKLATLSHEIGHAIIHNAPMRKSESQIEYEADSMSILMQSTVGVDITDSQKRHFSSHYRKYEKVLQEKYQDQVNVDDQISNAMKESFNQVFSAYNTNIDKIHEYLDQAISEQDLMRENLVQKSKTKAQSKSFNMELER